MLFFLIDCKYLQVGRYFMKKKTIFSYEQLCQAMYLSRIDISWHKSNLQLKLLTFQKTIGGE
jgi:hypothetical protein